MAITHTSINVLPLVNNSPGNCMHNQQKKKQVKIHKNYEDAYKYASHIILPPGQHDIVYYKDKTNNTIQCLMAVGNINSDIPIIFTPNNYMEHAFSDKITDNIKDRVDVIIDKIIDQVTWNNWDNDTSINKPGDTIIEDFNPDGDNPNINIPTDKVENEDITIEDFNPGGNDNTDQNIKDPAVDENNEGNTDNNGSDETNIEDFNPGGNTNPDVKEDTIDNDNEINKPDNTDIDVEIHNPTTDNIDIEISNPDDIDVDNIYTDLGNLDNANNADINTDNIEPDTDKEINKSDNMDDTNTNIDNINNGNTDTPIWEEEIL